MSKEVGKVIKIDPTQMTLKIPTGKGCGFCKVKENCTFHGPDTAYREITVPRQAEFSPGDLATIEFPESVQNISALIIFGLPIPLLVGGYLLAEYYFHIPWSEFWGILAGFGIYSVLLYWANRWLAALPRFTPKISKIEPSQRQISQNVN